MTNRGFTIIELLIVITIIAILVGVAVPYYNDYIYDARLSTLKQNLATYRQVLNQFRGDNLRGPFKVEIAGTVTLPANGWTTSAHSELTAGPIQNIGGTFTRRSNLKYLPGMPAFINPQDGSPIPASAWTFGDPTAYFYDDDGDGIFDIDNEFAYTEMGDPAPPNTFASGVDQQIINTVDFSTVTAVNATPLDYTTFTVSAGGVTY